MQVRISRCACTAALFAIGALIFAARYDPAIASCWGSNPEGNRTCQEFVTKGGLHLQLCEDQAGDCERAGYAPAVKSQNEAEAAPTDETETDSPGNSVEQRDAQSSGGSTDHSSSQTAESAYTGFLIFAGVLIAVILFGRMMGLSAGMSVFVLFAGFIAGLLDGGRRRRW